MALAPKFAGQRFSAQFKAGSTENVIHTLELYLDYVCPFSKKMFDTVYGKVFDVIKAKYADKVQVIFRHQVQPWHPSSTLTHESALAVNRLAPHKFWAFSAALFANQTKFFDVNVANESRNATYIRLSEIAEEAGIDGSKVLKGLRINDKPGKDGALNTGNLITDDLKLCIKAARLVGVHVSPTVIFDGNVENSIGSSYTPKDWEAWLEKNVTE